MQITFNEESDNGKQYQERILTHTGQRIRVKLGKVVMIAVVLEMTALTNVVNFWELQICQANL